MGHRDFGMMDSVEGVGSVVSTAVRGLEEAVYSFACSVTNYKDALSQLEMFGALAGPLGSTEAAVAVACEQGHAAKESLVTALKVMPGRRAKAAQALSRVAELRSHLLNLVNEAKRVAEATAHERSSPYGDHLEQNRQCWSDESSKLAQLWRQLHTAHCKAEEGIEQEEKRMEDMRNVNKPTTPRVVRMLDQRKDRKRLASEGCNNRPRIKAPDVG